MSEPLHGVVYYRYAYSIVTHAVGPFGWAEIGPTATRFGTHYSVPTRMKSDGQSLNLRQVWNTLDEGHAVLFCATGLLPEGAT